MVDYEKPTYEVGARQTRIATVFFITAAMFGGLAVFGMCEGGFASVTMTGAGTVVKTATGYVLDRASGTMVIVG